MEKLKHEQASTIRGGWLGGAPPRWMTKVSIELGKATKGFINGFLAGTRSL